jgi:serine/threonine protein kinase
VSTAPYEPIPERTQVHVDRLLGATVGEYRVLERVVEGRLGTLYRAVHVASGKAVTLEVLRAGLVGSDDEVSAANALKVPGVVPVLGSGEVSDGRRFRVMEPLEGASLDQRVQRTPKDTARLLELVAAVLETTHAWSVVHGQLGPSCVFVVGGAARLIDFGLARKKVTTQDDLRALGMLGFSLLSGEELREGAAPPPEGPGVPERLDRLLRELMEARIADASAARRELARLELPPPVAPVPGKKSSRVGLGVALAALLGGSAVAYVLWPEPPVEEPAVAFTAEEEAELVEEPEPAVAPPTPEEPVEVAEPKPAPRTVKAPRPVPSAEQLSSLIRKLEAQLRRQKPRYGDDVEQALFVLNKQRLRLTGSPSVADRQDVARQLAGWRRSYLRTR